LRGTDPRAKCSDRDFINFIETIGPAATARKLKCNIRNVYKRRENIERVAGRQITTPPPSGFRTVTTRRNIEHAARLHYDCLNGIVLSALMLISGLAPPQPPCAGSSSSPRN
jgi:hypothetical protein